MGKFNLFSVVSCEVNCWKNGETKPHKKGPFDTDHTVNLHQNGVVMGQCSWSSAMGMCHFLECEMFLLHESRSLYHSADGGNYWESERFT